MRSRNWFFVSFGLSFLLKCRDLICRETSQNVWIFMFILFFKLMKWKHLLISEWVFLMLLIRLANVVSFTWISTIIVYVSIFLFQFIKMQTLQKKRRLYLQRRKWKNWEFWIPKQLRICVCNNVFIEIVWCWRVVVDSV